VPSRRQRARSEPFCQVNLVKKGTPMQAAKASILRAWDLRATQVR